ncbi:UDP-N-acetylmuramyl-tripeptide synthetase [Spirochaetia bacterium]|nr:UDP-N-acetylmuramyl-tripeptide synthetase [Spirochaetia bacterium]
MERHLSAFLTPTIAGKIGFTENIPKDRDPVVTGIEYDSRKVRPGNLYCALTGLHTDGHHFIDAALSHGASVIVHQHAIPVHDGIVSIKVQDSRFALSPVSASFYDFPSQSMTLIGVTGTEGKSTTVSLVHQLLCAAGKTAGFISTVQHGDGTTIVENPEHQTTPEASTIQRMLAVMRDNCCEYVVLEASSHGLSPRTNRLGDVAFDVGIMTNVAHEHLEFHGTWEQYRHDKANLFRSLDNCNHQKRMNPAESFGVLNADDKSAGYFADATGKPVYRFSVQGKPADIRLLNLESGMTGNRYTVSCSGSDKYLSFEDHLPGAFNAGNVLAALLTVSKSTGIGIHDLVPFVQRLKPVCGRMTRIDHGQPFEVIVDYAHTPSSFAALFPALRKRITGNIISVFGSPGDRDTQKRPEQGKIAARFSDYILLTDEDPRGESSMDILQDIAAGCPDANLLFIPDRPSAIRKAFSMAKVDDLVLLLGKGHENTIIYNDYVMPFNEIAEAKKALSEMGFPEH